MTNEQSQDDTDWEAMPEAMGDDMPMDDMPSPEELEAMEEESQRAAPEEQTEQTERTERTEQASPAPEAKSSNEPTQAPRKPLYISPVIEQTEQSHLPMPPPICEQCALSMWYQQDAQLICYCSRMHTITWRPDLK